MDQARGQSEAIASAQSMVRQGRQDSIDEIEKGKQCGWGTEHGDIMHNGIFQAG